MHIVDLSIFVIYIVLMLGVGFFFYNKNDSMEDYFVGGRKISSFHIGLSVVATDVGGGFSIGLGGLGFAMGLSGSWMLFTGLIGAWLSAVILIPKISELSQVKKYFTLPEVFHTFYDKKTAMAAAVISIVGYIGFTSSQILAGAKLASATFDTFAFSDVLIAIGVLTVVYTTIGGLKAVIFTDTIQWIILMGGLLFIGIPVAYFKIGGISAIRAVLDPSFLQFTNITWVTLINWGATIIPIWFVGMTLYQRIFACRSKKEAQKAWFIAGFLEWPIMAMLGVTLGMFARVAMEQGMISSAAGMDAELGLPLLLKTVLPIGAMGLLLSAYFSAIMSTADSCLMAASGNVVSDVIGSVKKLSPSKTLRLSQISTLTIGVLAIWIALQMTNVLELMLLSYAFMVSGLFVPILGAIFWKKKSSWGAFLAMLGGGSITTYLVITKANLPYGLDANIFGIMGSLGFFLVGSLLLPDPAHNNNTAKGS